MRLRELLVRRLLSWLGLWALCCVVVLFLMGRQDVKTEYNSASEMVNDLHRALSRVEPLGNLEFEVFRQQLAQAKADREQRETRRELMLTGAMLLLMAAGSGIVVWYSLKPALNQPLQKLVQWLGDYEKSERQLLAPGKLPIAQSELKIDELKSIHDSVMQLVQTLNAEQQKSRRLLNHVIDAQEKERQTIAQDLHDYFGQSLTSIAVNSAFLVRSTEAQTREAAQAVHDQTQEMMGWLRNSLQELKPHLLLEVSLRDAALDLLDNWARRHGWYVDFGWDPNMPPLKEEAPIALYRTMQEALNNIARHTSAKKVKVLAGFDMEKSEFILVVENDGVHGGESITPSLGLTGIRERIGNLHGRVRWSIHDTTFVLTCFLPLEKTPDVT